MTSLTPLLWRHYPHYYDVTNTAAMTSRHVTTPTTMTSQPPLLWRHNPRYYDVTTPATITSQPADYYRLLLWSALTSALLLLASASCCCGALWRVLCCCWLLPAAAVERSTEACYYDVTTPATMTSYWHLYSIPCIILPSNHLEYSHRTPDIHTVPGCLHLNPGLIHLLVLMPFLWCLSKLCLKYVLIVLC